MALALLLEVGDRIDCDAVKAMVGADTRPAVPELKPGAVDLTAYDHLLAEVGT